MTNPYGQPAYGPPSGNMPVPYGQPMKQNYGAPGYGAPGGMPGGMPGMGMPGGGQEIKDYKGWAIASIFMCLILGIFAIMKSNEVGTFKQQGNFAAAEQASKTTKMLCLISTILFGLGCLASAAIVLFTVILGVGVASTTDYPSTYDNCYYSGTYYC